MSIIYAKVLQELLESRKERARGRTFTDYSAAKEAAYQEALLAGMDALVRQARPVSGDHNGSVSGGVGVGPIDCQPAADLRRAGTDRDDVGHTPEVEVATPPAGTREQIHHAAYAAVAHAIDADLPADVAANLASAREVLPILEERIRAKFTPALNTGTPMDALVLVAEAIRELKAELTPSEDRS